MQRIALGSAPTLMVHRPGFTIEQDYIEDVPYEEVTVDEPTIIETPLVNFLESNTDSISLHDLTADCVVPTWGNQELTIAHQDFIRTVHDAARDYFTGENVSSPDILPLVPRSRMYGNQQCCDLPQSIFHTPLSRAKASDHVLLFPLQGIPYHSST